MTSTRPSPFGQFCLDRGVRLAAGLAVVVAIPMAVLFYFQFRSLNDIEEDLGGRAASVEQRHRRVADASVEDT